FRKKNADADGSRRLQVRETPERSYSLLTTHHSPLTTYYSLLTTHHSLLTTFPGLALLSARRYILRNNGFSSRALRIGCLPPSAWPRGGKAWLPPRMPSTLTVVTPLPSTAPLSARSNFFFHSNVPMATGSPNFKATPFSNPNTSS